MTDLPQSSTSTVHTAAVIAVLAAARHETHSENHLARIQTKALTARGNSIGKDLRAAGERLNTARRLRRTAIQQLDELERRQAEQRPDRNGDDT